MEDADVHAYLEHALEVFGRIAVWPAVTGPSPPSPRRSSGGSTLSVDVTAQLAELIRRRCFGATAETIYDLADGR